jgi:hypothetical protein
MAGEVYCKADEATSSAGCRLESPNERCRCRELLKRLLRIGARPRQEVAAWAVRQGGREWAADGIDSCGCEGGRLVSYERQETGGFGVQRVYGCVGTIRAQCGMASNLSRQPSAAGMLGHAEAGGH